MPNISKYDWLALKEKFFTHKSRNPGLTLRQFAKDNNIPEKVLRNKVSSLKWMEEYDQRRDEQDKIIGEQVAIRQRKALEELNREFLNSEVDIRRRHAILGRNMQIIASIAFKDYIRADLLTPKEAIEMGRIGAEIERQAYGLADKVEFLGTVQMNDSRDEYKSVDEHEAEARKMYELADKLEKFVDGKSRRVSEAEASVVVPFVRKK
jgi:hypothetical protein